MSPELIRALARSGAPQPVLITLRTVAAEARREGLASLERAASGFVAGRRLENAPVLSGFATPAAVYTLAARPDVLHVGLDRLVRPAGQVGAAQIGADRMLGIGVTGLGRSIAVVDSGIDLQHPDLQHPGGGSWPGANIADGTADLADCSGHGTEVAGVLKGPQGIAPDAGLVVLKVFGARDGCKTARASDVLAAIDWAVSHAAGTDLDAINLSLADDTPRPGFCDGEDPAGAAAFGAARAAGLSVVAAAGNEGRTAGLPWPACLSSVASVGMVYSLASGPLQWGGTASCTDLVTGPDVIPCASNAGSGLSALAPGVDWTTAVSGGGRRRASRGHRPRHPQPRELSSSPGRPARSAIRFSPSTSCARRACPSATRGRGGRRPASTWAPHSRRRARSRAAAREQRFRTEPRTASSATRSPRRSSERSRRCRSPSRSTIRTRSSSS